MTEAEGFVVQGNKTAWRNHALRAMALGLVAADLFSISLAYQQAHLYQRTPSNIAAALLLSEVLGVWSVLESAMACLLIGLTAGRTPMLSVNCDGILVRAIGYRPRRLAWQEIKSIYACSPFSFPLFGWQQMKSIVLVPHCPASLYEHLTAWERVVTFGSTKPNAAQRLGWVGVPGIALDVAPDEFMKRLNDFYLTYAWQPGLPVGPIPLAIPHIQNPRVALPAPTVQTHEADVVQSRDVCSQTRVVMSETTQRRALHRTSRPLKAGIRRRMPNMRGTERMSAMLKQDTETQTVQTVASVPAETDQRVTPQELTAAIEAIERRKAETQKRIAETIPVDQAVRELGIDATPEEVLAEVRAQRAAREGVTPPPLVEKPVPPLANNDKQRFEAFIRQFVKESGLDALPDEVIARLRSRRLARAQDTVVAQPTGTNTGSSNKRARRGIGIGMAAFLFFGWSTGWWQHAPSFPTYNITSVDSKPITKTLAEIPENHPVVSDTANLEKIIEGKPENTISVTDNVDVDEAEWAVTKTNGHYYVRAYLPARVSDAELKAAPLILYNDEGDTPGHSSVKVTVPLNETKVVAAHEDGDNSTITLSNVHLDDNSYDKW